MLYFIYLGGHYKVIFAESLDGMSIKLNLDDTIKNIDIGVMPLLVGNIGYAINELHGLLKILKAKLSLNAVVFYNLPVFVDFGEVFGNITMQHRWRTTFTGKTCLIG